jgi:hypothetical protein
MFTKTLKNIIFLKIKFFLWSIFINCFVVISNSASAPPVYTAKSGFSSEKVFCLFSTKTKSEQTAIQQSHIIINPLLTSFARSVRESIAFGSYRTDLAPSSLGLFEKPQAILSRTDLAVG